MEMSSTGNIFPIFHEKCPAQQSMIVARDTTEKIWAHRFYAEQKMAAGGLWSTISPSRVAKPTKSFDFFRLKHGKTAIVR